MTEGLFPPKDTPRDAFFYGVNQRGGATFVLQWKLPPDSVGIWRSHTGIDFDPRSEFASGFVLLQRIPGPDDLQALLAPQPPAPPPPADPGPSDLRTALEEAIDKALIDQGAADHTNVPPLVRAVLHVLAEQWPASLWPAVTDAMRRERDIAQAHVKLTNQERLNANRRTLDYQHGMAAMELQHQQRQTELHGVITREVERRRQAEADRDELMGVVSDWRDAFAAVAAQPRKAMLLRRKTSERFWQQRAGLLECRRVFLLYADMHRAKGTPEGDEKADRNASLAEMCKTAIRGERA